MPQADCGFADTTQATGQVLLMGYGPTLKVNIGFDPKFKPGASAIPTPGITDVDALVDTGATESCIDNLLATRLKLPVVDRRTIAGAGGKHTVNIYQAQVHIPSLRTNILGTFAGVKLIDGGQRHHALIGRTFLMNFKMVYEGKTGKVTLSST